MDKDHRERNVMVWGEPHIVTVYRKSETVYEAIGNYMCETICVNDQSEGAAIKRWPIGLLIFTDNGRYSSQVMRPDLPKFASNSRTQGTPDEYKAVVNGSIANFGTYTVNEANKTITIRYDGSTFPNRKGAEDTRPVVIEGDELRITNPAPSTGGPTSQLVYRRAK